MPPDWRHFAGSSLCFSVRLGRPTRTYRNMPLFITQLDVASDAFEGLHRPDHIAEHDQPNVNQCKS